MANPKKAMAPYSDAEVDSPKSPRHHNQSFGSPNFVEDDDNEASRVSFNESPYTSFGTSSGRHGRGAGGRSRADRDSAASGAGFNNNGHTLFKDPSSIGKIRHLKKEDGEPLWREDIQYDFLRAVFDDERKVFTNSYEPEAIGKQCFADLYIDTMARSSKTSKVLHDKLLNDRDAAKSMAMVCLLVNIGRMNTTLNFFPEMRAQLRTYHAIPSLQVYQDPHAYKQLQDAPRLKSILKGGSEDRPEPRTLEQLKSEEVPRTNPVNLIFLICHSAAKVAELHFPPGYEFHDMIMKTDLSSRSRAAAFLWVMWFYLESDFTEEGCEENPFGAGVDYGVCVANQGVPVLEKLSPEEKALENVDTELEINFGMEKKKLRYRILQQDKYYDTPTVKRSSRASARPAPTPKEPPADSDRAGGPPAILPRIRPSKNESDADSTRSTPPPRVINRGSGAGGSRRSGPLKYQMVDGSSPVRQPPLIQQLHMQQQEQLVRKRKRPQKSHPMDQDDYDDAGSHTPTAPSRKPRPPTAHQIAVENNRKQRIEYLLARGMDRKHHRARKSRRNEGAIIRALHRLEKVEDPFEESETEMRRSFNSNMFPPFAGAAQQNFTDNAFREYGFLGLVQLKDEQDDFGEEFSAYSSAIRRSCRRLNRWEFSGLPLEEIAPVKRPRVNGNADDDFKDPNETEEEPDFDGDADMSLLESTAAASPAPAAAKRRPRTTPASRARGARASTGRTKAASTPINRRRRTTAASAAAVNGNGAADEGEDATVVASGADGEGEADAEDMDIDDTVEDATEDVGTPAETKRAPADDDNDNDDDEELNDMDKTLLGMGDADTDSD